MTPEKVAYALQLLADPDRSLSSIAALLKISRTTLYKALPELVSTRAGPGPPHCADRRASRSDSQAIRQDSRHPPPCQLSAQLTPHRSKREPQRANKIKDLWCWTILLANSTTVRVRKCQPGQKQWPDLDQHRRQRVKPTLDNYTLRVPRPDRASAGTGRQAPLCRQHQRPGSATVDRRVAWPASDNYEPAGGSAVPMETTTTARAPFRPN